MSFITQPFVKMAEWARSPHKKLVFDVKEGSMDDIQLLGMIFVIFKSIYSL